jgi:hypothetical protein
VKLIITTMSSFITFNITEISLLWGIVNVSMLISHLSFHSIAIKSHQVLTRMPSSHFQFSWS